MIHIAKKELGLDDDTYRDVLWTVGRVRSAAELDAKGRADLIKHFQSRGWNGGPKGQVPRARPSRENAAMLAKIDRILEQLGRDRSYADRTARHMFGVERTVWLTPSQMHKLVAALQIHANRQASAK